MVVISYPCCDNSEVLDSGIKHDCVCIIGVKLPRMLSRPAARQHPTEFDTNNTHTIMFDPHYNMLPPFFPQQPIFCSLKAI